MKKKELLSFCKDLNIKGVHSKKKIEIESILKKTKINQLEQNSLDKKDPISLDPFEDWELDDLLHAVYLNGYYYQSKSLDNYINSISNEKYIDPINPSINIPEDIVKLYYKEKQQTKISFGFIYQTSSFDSFNFYFIFLHIPTTYKIFTTLPTRRMFDTYYILLGLFPSDISTESETLKSLDISSTSECLLFKIIDFYKSGKLLEMKNNVIKISKMDSLPLYPHDWIVNHKIDTISTNSPYIKLLKSIENYE